MTIKNQSNTLLDVLFPIAVLVISLVVTVRSLGVDAGGYTQFSLILGALAASLVGLKNGRSWLEMEAGMVTTIAAGLKAILILLVVGGLIGVWILSGTVPAIIFYGTQLLAPEWFYPAVALICAVAGLSIGSSWTVAGALGVGLMGVSQVMGLSPAITAGAVISGAYLGDKMSPLSDTTNLASGITQTELFSHIQHMTWTTVPAFTIALAVYVIAGWGQGALVQDTSLSVMTEILAKNYYLGFPVFIPLILLFGLAVRKVAVLPTLMFGLISGILVALVWQGHQFEVHGGSGAGQVFQQVVTVIIDGFQGNTGNQNLDQLLSKGGMSSMLGTVFLIICALGFGGAYEKAGLLHSLVGYIMKMVRGVGSLVSATLATCIGANLLCADQYIAIVVPSRMYLEIYKRQQLNPLNLSRAVEDAGTLTSVLIPWNTCALFMAGTLGVTAWGWGEGLASMAYAPWAILCWLCPVISAIYGAFGFKILKVKPAS